MPLPPPSSTLTTLIWESAIATAMSWLPSLLKSPAAIAVAPNGVSKDSSPPKLPSALPSMTIAPSVESPIAMSSTWSLLKSASTSPIASVSNGL